MRKRKEHSAEEMEAVKVRLLKHRGMLGAVIGDCAITFQRSEDFETACAIRDRSTELVHTCYALENIDMFIEAAKREGPRHLPIKLDECGLENG